MKKLLLITFAILSSSILMAQMPNFGIRAGVTGSTLSTDVNDVFSSDNMLGFQAGLFLRVHVKRFYIQPELTYNHRSTKLQYEVTPIVDIHGESVGANTEMKIGTIDIPALLGFTIVKSKVFNFRVFAGPAISFATNNSLEYSYTTSDGETVDPGDVHDPLTIDDFNKTAWYAQGGAGIDFLFLTFDIRYEKGLSALYNSGDFDFSNNLWVFSLGIKFM